jgi:DNA modification methylase
MSLLRSGEIVHGDTLHILAEEPAESFDTIFLDWPYPQASPVRGKDDGAAARIFGPVSFLVRLLRETNRIAKPGAHIYLFGDWKGIPDAGYAMSVTGWFPTTIIAWDKQYVGTGGVWRSSWDPIFFASKGPADVRTDKAYGNTLRTPSVRAGRSHPYEKPEALWARLCDVSVAKGCRVLDPFAGSGSSRAPTLAAGGDWYGIDVDAAFADAEPKR